MTVATHTRTKYSEGGHQESLPHNSYNYTQHNTLPELYVFVCVYNLSYVSKIHNIII